MKKTTFYLMTYCSLLFYLAIPIFLLGQSPGGYKGNVELWLIADQPQVGGAGSLKDNQSITLWRDLSGKGRDHVQSDPKLVPVYKKSGDLLNFQPAIHFDSINPRLVGPDLNIQEDKAYYIFYVSKFDKWVDGASVVYSLNDRRNNNNGWYNGVPYFSTAGTGSAYRHINTNSKLKKYGINTVIRPNGTILEQMSYYNSIPQNFVPRAMTVTAGQSIVGNRFITGNGNPFYGDIQEIIVLSGPKNTYLSDHDLQKIHSYLSIKYGISLDKNSQPDYLNYDGNVVWKGSNNQGYQNDIFGIARDDNSGLYQKQSVSFDRSIMTVFVGDSIANLNIENSGKLDDGNYLLFGSNGLNDYLLDYDHKKGDQFANGILVKDINFRNQVVLKAQTTGKNRFVVNIRPNLSSSMILVSPDSTFKPATTRVYLVENRVVKNVEINDGDYVGFAIYGNAPGGVVNGLRLWLRADDHKSLIFNQGTNDLMVWKDQTANQNNYYYSSVKNNIKVPPIYSNCDSKMNFFPSIYFAENASLAIDKGPMSTNKPQNSTSFVVYHSKRYASEDRTYTHGFGGVNPNNSSTRHPAVGFYSREGTGRVATTERIYNGTVKGFNVGATALHMVRLSTYDSPRGRLIEHDFGGLSDSFVPSKRDFGEEFLMANGGTLGAASVNSGKFDGLISELFFYERELNEQEKSRIRTYLGMKYAITLYEEGSTEKNKKPYNYVLSDNTTNVWKGKSQPYSDYHRNVAGLVRDDESNLFVNKARSTDVNALVTIQAGDDTSCGQGSSPALVKDLSGLFWGNNGANGTTVLDPNASASCGGLESRMNRIWLANKTNIDKQQVTLTVDYSDLFPYNSTYKVFLLIADSAEDINNNNWTKAIPGEWVNGEVKFKYNFTNVNTYFTFGGVRVPGICTTCTFNGYKNINLSTIWKGSSNRGKLNKTVDLGDGFSANIVISDPGKVLRNGYPRNNGKTLELQRRGNSNTDTKPITTTITYTGGSAATSFEIFDIDSQAMRSDEIEVYGMCGEGVVKPKLTYVAAKKKSSYVISDNKAIAKNSGPNSSSGYNAARGKLLVDFSTAVEKIVIVYNQKYSKTSTGNQRIGIGTLNLYCPKPLEINEDGLAFTLQVPESTLTCEEVPFTFRIVNTNCDSKIVNLNEVLPTGMLWVKESLSIEEGAGTPTSNSYGGTEQLNIQQIIIPGATTTTVTVRAKFTVDTATTYTTRASINYVNIFEKDVVYESCDIIDGCGDTTIKSVSAGIPDPITIDNITADSSCISEDKTATINIHITNPNQALDEVTLSASITQGFDYIANSLTSTFNSMGDIIIEEDGFEVEDFTLPLGTHTISFKVKAPASLPTGLNELEVNLDMTSSSTLDCAKIDISSANMDVILPFCTYCTNDPNLNPSTEASQVGITTLEKTLEGWPYNIYNGFIVLESKNKGFVITRTKSDLIPANKLVEGMIIYDTEDKCIKLYNGVEWHCIERTCP